MSITHSLQAELSAATPKRGRRRIDQQQLGLVRIISQRVCHDQAFAGEDECSLQHSGVSVEPIQCKRVRGCVHAAWS